MKNLFFIKPLKMDLTQGSETLEKLNLTPGKYPKENIQDLYKSFGVKGFSMAMSSNAFLLY
jgi:hypothetical protein